jgi:hypothetical protein
MRTFRIDDVPAKLLGAVVARHPYRDAILGDLAESRQQVATEAGAGAAARWYRREAIRSALSIVARCAVRPGDAWYASALASSAYAVAVRVAAPAAFALGRILSVAPGRAFATFYLAVIALIALGAAMFVGANRRTAGLASVLFLAAAVAVGVLHVATAPPHERWFRVAKVWVFVVASTIGSVAGIISGGGNASMDSHNRSKALL